MVMMPKTDAAIPLAPLQGRRVAILGYGNQGRPQALNLHDSGIEVRIGARARSTRRAQAEADGLLLHAGHLGAAQLVLTQR